MASPPPITRFMHRSSWSKYSTIGPWGARLEELAASSSSLEETTWMPLWHSCISSPLIPYIARIFDLLALLPLPPMAPKELEECPTLLTVPATRLCFAFCGLSTFLDPFQIFPIGKTTRFGLGEWNNLAISATSAWVLLPVHGHALAFVSVVLHSGNHLLGQKSASVVPTCSKAFLAAWLSWRFKGGGQTQEGVQVCFQTFAGLIQGGTVRCPGKRHGCSHKVYNTWASKNCKAQLCFQKIQNFLSAQENCANTEHNTAHGTCTVLSWKFAEEIHPVDTWFKVYNKEIYRILPTLIKAYCYLP